MADSRGAFLPRAAFTGGAMLAFAFLCWRLSSVDPEAPPSESRAPAPEDPRPEPGAGLNEEAPAILERMRLDSLPAGSPQGDSLPGAPATQDPSPSQAKFPSRGPTAPRPARAGPRQASPPARAAAPAYPARGGRKGALGPTASGARPSARAAALHAGAREKGGGRSLMGVGAGRTAFGAGVWCAVGDVSPAPGVDTRTRFAYYDVPGRTPEEISAAMAELVAAGAAGAHRAAGTARQQVTASFHLSEQEGLCRADEVGVDLDIVITLPRLREGVTLPLQQRWGKFQNVIAAHENSHKAIAVRVANDLRRELDFVAAQQAPCAQMSAGFDAAQRRAHAEMQRRQSEYDAYTATHCGSTL